VRGVTAQSAIFALGTGAHTYLEFDIRNGAGADAVATLASLSEPRTTIGGVNLVVGVRPGLWARLAADDAPDRVEDFDQPVDGAEGFTMPTTQRDLWFWVSGAGPDVVFDAARGAISALAGCSTVASEVEDWARSFAVTRRTEERPSTARCSLASVLGSVRCTLCSGAWRAPRMGPVMP
jgi:putative iron-dependent peroxidase